MREYQLKLGIPHEQVYNQTMLILAGMLMVGLICNLLIRPVADLWFMTRAELADEQKLTHETLPATKTESSINSSSKLSPFVIMMAWLMVLIPLGWGIFKTIISVGKFFN
jgi:hypothetical protein